MSNSAPDSTPFDAQRWASDLLRAVEYRTPIHALSAVHPELTSEDAYLVQVLAMAERIRRNDPVVGAKVTVHHRHPAFCLYPRSASMGMFEVADLTQMVEPRAQAVLVFRMFKELSGTAVTQADVRDATESVVAGIEVIDHRLGPPDRLELVDVIADNGGVAKVLIGEHGIDISHGAAALRTLEVDFTLDGAAVGPAPDAITSPAEAVAALANHLGAQGGTLEKGWFVTVGPMSALAPLHVGAKVELRIGTMAPVVLRAR
jgi:2-keto-4-pentenoate hydratase